MSAYHKAFKMFAEPTDVERDVAARPEADYSCATCHGFGTTEDGEICRDCPPDTKDGHPHPESAVTH